MAKSIASRSKGLGTFKTPVVPGTEVTPTPYWYQPKGLNTLAKLSQIPPEYASSITNLMLDQGYLRSRYGYSILGDRIGDVVAVLSFTPADGAGVLLRIRINRLEIWDGSAWNLVGGVVFNGNLTDRFSWTGWGNEILIANGVDQILSYNPLSGVVVRLQESPAARHIQSFNGRVMASAVTEGAFFGYRIRWSAKLDNTDWTAQTTTDAIGAGYEDLKATPGGFVDEVMGTYPLSDETSLVVRDNSLWLALVTGDVDKPFRFSRLTNEIGCRARHSIAITPFGVMFLSHEDVMLVDQSGPKSMAGQIRRTIFSEIDDYPALTGMYDPRRQEYRLVNNATVYRYSFRDNGWTRDIYHPAIRHMSFVDYKSLGLTYDQLAGTFDALTGTFDQLGIVAAKEGVHIVSDLGEVFREDPDVTNDNSAQSVIEIVSGLLAAGSAIYKTGLIEAQLEYECEEVQRVVFEYSTDKGANWTQYSYVDLLPTSGPKIIAVRKTLESHNLQVKVRSESLGKLSLIGLNLMIVKGARVNP